MSEIVIRPVTYKSPESEKKQVLKTHDELYYWATESRFKAPWENEIFGVMSAFDGDKLVGTTSYAITPRGQAILSDVYTDENYRGQGIAKKVLAETMKVYEENNTRAIYLAAWDEWIRNIYRKYGFVNVGNMGGRGSFKLTLNKLGEDKVLFRPEQKTTLRPMGLGDQADITSLFCADFGRLVIKNYELGCYLGSYFEGEFFVLQNQVVKGVVPEEDRPKKGYRSIVLDGEETILGFGTIIPSSRRHEDHIGIIDVMVHPNYKEQAKDILAALEDNNELEHVYAYIEENEKEKIEMFKSLGYEQLTVLNNHLKIADESFSLLLFNKTLK